MKDWWDDHATAHEEFAVSNEGLRFETAPEHRWVLEVKFDG